jgi:hypothetical protein
LHTDWAYAFCGADTEAIVNRPTAKAAVI